MDDNRQKIAQGFGQHTFVYFLFFELYVFQSSPIVVEFFSVMPACVLLAGADVVCDVGAIFVWATFFGILSALCYVLSA